MGALDELIAQTSGNGGRGQSLDDLIAATSAPPEPQQPAPGGAAVYSEPDPSLQVAAPYEPGLLERLLSATPGGVLNRAADNPGYVAAAQGLAHGATAGLDQNIPGYGDYVRNERQQAQAQAPAAYRGGDIVGSLVSPTNITGSIPRQVASGALQGGARGFSDADPNAGMGARVARGAVGAGVGAGTAAVIGGGGRLLGTSEGVAQRVGDAARLKAMGVTGGSLEAFADQRGLPIDQAARAFVRQGEELVPPNLALPRSTGGWERAATPVMNTSGAAADQALRDAHAAGAQLPPDIRGSLARQLYQDADAAMTSGQGGAVPGASALSNEAAAVQRGPQITDPVALRQAKTAADQYAFKGAPGTPEAAAGRASLAHGNAIRGMLDDYTAQAPQAIDDAYAKASNDFGVTSTIARDARARAAAGTASAPLADSMRASLSGRVLGMVPPGSIADATANAARGVQGMGAAANGFANTVPGPVGGNAAAAAAAKWLGSKGVQTGQQPANTQVGDSTATGHGNRLGAAADQLLREDPQAFGQWLDDFQKAEQEGSGAMSALAGRLMIDSSAFRAGPGLRLQQMTR